MSDGLDARRDGVHYFVGRSDGRISDALVLELHSVAKSFTVGVFDVTFVREIMFRRGV